MEQDNLSATESPECPTKQTESLSWRFSHCHMELEARAGGRGASGDREAGLSRETVDGRTERRRGFEDLHRGRGGDQLGLSSRGDHARGLGIAIAALTSPRWFEHRGGEIDFI